jgi:hypothetical protein
MTLLAIALLLPSIPARAAEPRRIACNLGVFTRPERARHLELIAMLKDKVGEVREGEGGYAFRYSPDLLRPLTEWVTLETKCCPFLDFQIELEPQPDGAAWLRLGGDEDVREFIRTEFQPLLQIAHAKAGAR